MLPNAVFYALVVSPDDEQQVIGQIIGFAWDDELIRVARAGANLHVIFSEHLDLAAQKKLEAILHRDVTPVLAADGSPVWQTVHQWGPES